MRSPRLIGVLMAIVVAVPAAGVADTKPAEELARLKKDLEKLWEVLEHDRRPGTTGAEQQAAVDRFYRQAAEIGRHALALAESYPGAPESCTTVVWAWNSLDYSPETGPVLDAAFDLMARRHLDADAILPVVRIAWVQAAGCPQAETFLRAAADRSPNRKVRALACFSLGRHQQQLIITARDLDDPERGQSLRQQLGPDRVRLLRERKPEDLRREAETLYERTIREYGDLQPMGKDFPPLGEQARGDLFKLRHLTPGCIVPEIDGEDIDGRRMKLSDFRGKVVVISFWATWCGPCMGMVPDEKAMVERMKGRPFALVGVNGDEDRPAARKVAAEKGINWRSFWDGGRKEGTAVKWGVNGWPTVYLVDSKGVIRDGGLGLRGAALDKAVDGLVVETEAAAKALGEPAR